MKCSKCGSEVPKGQKFCGNCGNKIIEEPKKEENDVNKPNVANKKIDIGNLLSILVPLILTIAIFGGMWFFIFQPAFFPTDLQKYSVAAENSASWYFATWCSVDELKCKAIEYDDGIVIVKCETTNPDVIDIYDSDVIYYGYKPKTDGVHYEQYVSADKQTVLDILKGVKSSDTEEEEQEEEIEIPVSAEDAYIGSFDQNSYYMYIYLTPEEEAKHNFSSRLTEIGGIWQEQFDGEKYIIYAKIDLYDKIYEKISNMSGVERVEKTNDLVYITREDENNNEVAEDETVISVISKEYSVTYREFYNICEQYGRVMDTPENGFESESMFMLSIIVDKSDAERICSELEKNDKISQVIY